MIFIVSGEASLMKSSGPYRRSGREALSQVENCVRTVASCAADHLMPYALAVRSAMYLSTAA